MGLEVFQLGTITMYVEDIMAACRKVMDGDEEALQQLGLDNVSYLRQSPLNPLPDNLQVNYTYALNITIAARELQFTINEEQCKIAMRLMQTIAHYKGITLYHNVDGQDVAEVMLSLIHEEQEHLKALHPNKSDIAGSDSEAQEEQLAKGEATANDIPPLPPAAVSKQSHLSDSADSEPHETAPLPTPDNIPSSVLKVDDNSQSHSSSDDELVEVLVPRKAVQSTPSVTIPTVATPSAATPCVTTTSVTTPSAAMPSVTMPSDRTPSVTGSSVTSSYVNTSSKNKHWQCSLCLFFRTHLQRHIAAKHPNTFTCKPEQIALVHRHNKLSRSESGKKPVRQFQCTYKKCGTIITCIGQHLLRTHKIQDQRQRAKVQSRCLRLSGGTSRKRAAPNPPVKSPASKVRKTVTPKPTKRRRHGTSGRNRATLALLSLGEQHRSRRNCGPPSTQGRRGRGRYQQLRR